MRIAHVSFSTFGGAGMVADSLSAGLREQGIDSKFFYLTDSNLWSSPLRFPKITVFAAADKFLIGKKGVHQQMSILRSRLSSRLEAEIAHFNPDIIHLHWIEGVLDDQALLRLSPGRKLVWTLHDMRPFTGGCHHSGDCLGFKGGCSACPISRFPLAALPAQNLRSRESTLRHLKIKFVACSPGIQNLAVNSKLLLEHSVVKIPNPIGKKFFTEKCDLEARRSGALFIAGSLLDPNKGLAELLNWKRQSDEVFELRLVGAGNVKVFDHEPIQLLGLLDRDSLIRVLDMSEYLIVNSFSETAPLVVAEAAARGAIPLIRSRLKGAVDPSLVNAGVGFFDAPSDLPRVMSQINSSPSSISSRRLALRQASMALFAPSEVARKYQELYESL